LPRRLSLTEEAFTEEAFTEEAFTEKVFTEESEQVGRFRRVCVCMLMMTL